MPSRPAIRRCAVCGRRNPDAYVAICGKDLTRYYCGWPHDCFRETAKTRTGVDHHA